ncbi:uncharacterized protein LOC108021867 isoform X3 [Drosophila biarmipes]|uniref:uncharacterized protein LOC108021867 isoform X4 n=1 Tax=Drosophila biarmipes TaxID=125945 RepID=UPI001CDB44BF|nr:uncharacterized protein LOC108021867 isoform X4 [Drosophila biarmipes]XP_043947408.1 uncharacterized protein LOC108021867 isoform X3 [Drosophila biarmipes]
MVRANRKPPLIVLPKNFASQSPFLTHLRKRLQWTRDLLKLNCELRQTKNYNRGENELHHLGYCLGLEASTPAIGPIAFQLLTWRYSAYYSIGRSISFLHLP